MSDPMMRPPGGAPPMGGNPMAGGSPIGAAPNAISRNTSALNPADVAMQAQTGQINKDMSMKQWLENTYKISVDAPFQQWLPVLKQNVQNKDAVGKAKSIASQSPMGGAPPMGGGAPPMRGAPAGGAPSPKVEQLMGMMGGQ